MWDRGEGNGYVDHFTDPLPGVNKKVEPFWGIPRIESYPFAGSAVVQFDSGSPRPHEDTRRAPEAYDQIAAFFQPDGAVIDTCAGEPCPAPPRD
jgi:hypothetical protein